MSEKSWAELMAGARTTPQRIHYLLPVVEDNEDPYSAFVDLVEDAVDWCSQQMARNKNELSGEDENQLTQMFTMSMLAMGFYASHDTNVGGHCDLVVEGPSEMLWLGEAKVFRGEANLFAGYRQLVSRYSTGYPNQSSGGLLIYVVDRATTAVIPRWRQTLAASGEGHNLRDDPKNMMNFYNSATHAGTGATLTIRHTPVALHHAPTDKPKPKPKP